MPYLDYNATAPLKEEVLEAMLPYLRADFYNPSSAYVGAKKVRKAIDAAREQVAALINAQPQEIIFTSGGTESVNLALKSLARHIGRKNSSILTSQIEHSAVLKTIGAMETVGFQVARCPVDKQARLDITAWEEAIDASKPGFASLMWVNNETGTIQPIAQAAAAARQADWAFHTDAVQAAGKIPVDVTAASIDYLSLSAHKLGGPKGVGALYCRSGLRLEPLIRGGGQEGGHRSGTENVPAIIGFGKTAELANKYLQETARKTAVLRNTLEQRLQAELPGIRLNANQAERAPNVTHFSIEGCSGAGMVILLDEYGLQCSTGSACMAGTHEPSHVTQAMGLNREQAQASLRLSLGPENTDEDIKAAVDAIKRAAAKLKSVQSVSTGPVVIYPKP